MSITTVGRVGECIGILKLGSMLCSNTAGDPFTRTNAVFPVTYLQPLQTEGLPCTRKEEDNCDRLLVHTLKREQEKTTYVVRPPPTMVRKSNSACTPSGRSNRIAQSSVAKSMARVASATYLPGHIRRPNPNDKCPSSLPPSTLI